ncbi:hypothetical protein PG993_013708 [Apiospora rasikravindrae]|uniref:Uncharacterized protein n=1 Tax=Apiospora rasikravindrae TaxID=990691 RepID=A0ABR1RRA2_9PEZI
MSSSNVPVAQDLADMNDLPTEMLIEILSQTSLVTPNKRVYWGPQGFYVQVHNLIQRYGPWRDPRPYFMLNRAIRVAAIDVFYRNNEFVVEAIPPSIPYTMSPASRLLGSVIPSQGLDVMKSLAVDIKIYDGHWRQIARRVAPTMRSLQTLTIVARYNSDSRVYRFQDMAVLNYLRRLVEARLWPLLTLDAAFRQLIVHIHSGLGSWIAGRDSRMDPTYFFEHKDLPAESSCWKHINNSNGASNGMVRWAQRSDFVEGMVCIIPNPEP